MSLLRAEDVRVPMNHLGRDAIDDREDVEPPLVLSDLGIQHHLEQQIAQLLRDRLVIMGVNRLQQFIRLLQRERLNRPQRLHPIPRTTCR